MAALATTPFRTGADQCALLGQFFGAYTMPTYTFQPNATTPFSNWDDPTAWTGGIVPNSSDADVDILAPQNAFSDITIKAGESFLAHSITDSSSYLAVAGSLSVQGNIGLTGASEIDMTGSSTLDAGSIVNNAVDIQGSGQIKAGDFTNNTKIVGSGLHISTASFNNNGILSAASGLLSITVSPGGLANLTGATLTGGSYVASANSTLSLNVGSVIATDSADIQLLGGTITSHDDATGADVSLVDTLHDVTSTGALTLGGNTSFTFGALSVSGTLSLQDAHLLSSQLTIESSGKLQVVSSSGPYSSSGSGSIDTPVVNNGLILVEAGSSLTVNGSVSGTGHFEITPGGRYFESSLFINAPTAQNVVFDNIEGYLQLNDPSTFSGHIVPSEVGGSVDSGPGDYIVLNGWSKDQITGESYSGDSTGGTLTLHQGSESLSLQFIGDYNLSSFTLSAGYAPASLDVIVSGAACYCTGTLIRTDRGEIAVEHLAVGDFVVTASGERRPIRWIGSRIVDCRSHASPRSVWPIRVAAHAFAANKPARDLFVSPDHALCVDEVLIPAFRLLNGNTIARHPVDRVTYWHVELDSHDLLLANGLPAESYMEMGNRRFFAAEAIVGLHAVPGARRNTHDDFCRPFVDDGPVLHAIRRQMDIRACRNGWSMTHRPDVHLLVDSRMVEGLQQGETLVFLFPATAAEVRLCSDTFVPDDLNGQGDDRTLGLKIRALHVGGGGARNQAIGLDAPILRAGFHALEREGDRICRWTNGDAVLPPSLWSSVAGTVVLQIDVDLDAIRSWMLASQAAATRAQGVLRLVGAA